jgi:hypothetical protein
LNFFDDPSWQLNFLGNAKVFLGNDKKKIVVGLMAIIDRTTKNILGNS